MVWPKYNIRKECVRELILIIYIYSLVPEISGSDFKHVIFNLVSLICIFRYSDFVIIMQSFECYGTSLMISHHWFRWWLGATRQQGITWVNVDPGPCLHMASLGHNELKIKVENATQTYRTTQSIIDCISAVHTTVVTIDIFAQPSAVIYNTNITYLTTFKDASTLYVNHLIFIDLQEFHWYLFYWNYKECK